jgi:hypothetical protein
MQKNHSRWLRLERQGESCRIASANHAEGQMTSHIGHPARVITECPRPEGRRTSLIHFVYGRSEYIFGDGTGLADDELAIPVAYTDACSRRNKRTRVLSPYLRLKEPKASRQHDQTRGHRQAHHELPRHRHDRAKNSRKSSMKATKAIPPMIIRPMRLSYTKEFPNATWPCNSYSISNGITAADE